MRVRSLGHVVLKVRDIGRSELFYSQVLGIPIVHRISDPVRMTFFSLGNHHDFAVIAVGEQAPRPDPTATGLAHVAFKVGDSTAEFDSMNTELGAAGVPVLYEAERAFTRSAHLLDPDGHEVELYIDTTDGADQVRRALAT